ncbi:peptidoglycan recognition protein family protein [Poriferisphaera sp. WC338]|uniref:peptidoglycan recognition protein family protein n=1 Tax=Poriferisphaera sp. WC338 TaxID=3425129 RepID=UPI003D81294F
MYEPVPGSKHQYTSVPQGADVSDQMIPPNTAHAPEESISGKWGWTPEKSKWRQQQLAKQRAKAGGSSYGTSVSSSATSRGAKTYYVGHVKVIGRKSWARKGPNLARANKMGRINKITVHHDGILMPKCSYSIAAKRMESIRGGHASSWADIGYHYCIDRDGRVWEGRPIDLQGAHVKKHNPNNVGVMVMGHFNKQSPSKQQLRALPQLLKALQGKYRISKKGVFTHQELMPTACPGKYLQRYMVGIRKNGMIV